MDRFDAAAALAVLCREMCEAVTVYAFNERAYEVPARRGFALRDALAQTKGSYSRGGLAVAMANEHGYDRIPMASGITRSARGRIQQRR